MPSNGFEILEMVVVHQNQKSFSTLVTDHLVVLERLLKNPTYEFPFLLTLAYAFKNIPHNSSIILVTAFVKGID